MNTKRSGITVSIAQTQEEISQALSFCASVYEQTYGTHWTVPPDLFFIARENGDIVATGGLTFAALHTQLASERYFRLTERMRHFMATNRERIVEFGRFASVKVRGAKAIVCSAISYCALVEIDFIFSWTNPTVSKYMSNRLGLDLWPIAVPLDLDGALQDPRWASPPVGFFQRAQPPILHQGVVPFWEHPVKMLAEESGVAAQVPAWQAVTPREIHVAAMKPTSVELSAPRLLRAESASTRSSVMPEIPSKLEPGALLPQKRPKAE